MLQTLKRTLASGTACAAKAYCNATLLDKVGDMLKLEIDSKNKTMQTTVMLEGEREPLDVSVGSYEFCPDAVSSGNGKGAVVLRDVRTSRSWLNTLLHTQFPDGVHIPLDSKLAALLGHVI